MGIVIEKPESGVTAVSFENIESFGAAELAGLACELENKGFSTAGLRLLADARCIYFACDDPRRTEYELTMHIYPRDTVMLGWLSVFALKPRAMSLLRSVYVNGIGGVFRDSEGPAELAGFLGGLPRVPETGALVNAAARLAASRTMRGITERRLGCNSRR